MKGAHNDIDLETTKALKEFDTFVSLITKGYKAAAFDLLRGINLNLVGKYFREKYEADSKEMIIFKFTSVIREFLILQETHSGLIH